ncbi:LCP family protein [Williamsia maris]|uniref:Transcriptional attenuator, LytR family n=1 Tax=Williamsia maris TaxID=72806 RepID=A0ABT1H7M5_9NOCA|nr:LCP family protein [Williamsia maris]MCP2174263.1 transcriptional attenuator, LytR family [Williamsia maris]
MHQPPDDRRARRAAPRDPGERRRPRPSTGATRSGAGARQASSRAAAAPGTTPRSGNPTPAQAPTPPVGPPRNGALTLSGNVGRVAVALLSVVVLLITGFAWSSITSLQNGVTRLDGLQLGDGRDGAVDILMVGTDSRVDAQGNPLSASEAAQLHAGDEVATNTDTILLIRIPNDGSSATAISIPRDSYVDVPGIGMSKINAAYGATKETKRAALVEAGTDPAEAEKEATVAGRKALIQTVAQLTGVQVDRYAEVGLVGFVLLTNAVNGVDVCLRNPVNEPLSGARFRAGRQTLDGAKALSFVRQRHDLPRGDLDRIVRQQVFMASLAQKVLSAGTLTDPGKLSALQDAVSRSIVIDDNWDILKFVEQLKDLTGGKVKFATIPVTDEQGWSEDGEQSVVTVDPAAVHRFTAALLTSKKGALARDEYTVDVTNAGTVDGLATNVSGIVAAKGYTRGTTDTKGTNDADSYIATSENNAGATDLAKQMGGLPVRVDGSVPSGHLRLVLTDSYTGPGSISDTGAQGQQDGAAPATPAAATTAPPITAAGSGPQCVN